MNDLTIRKTNRLVKDGQSVAHTHVVEFVRALVPEEQERFRRLLVSFYDVVHFSRQYGNGLYAEPKVIFETPTTVHIRSINRVRAARGRIYLFDPLAFQVIRQAHHPVDKINV